MKQLLALFGLMLSVLVKPVWAIELCTGDIQRQGMVVLITINDKVYRFQVGSITTNHFINERVAREQQWNIEVDSGGVKYTPPGDPTMGGVSISLSRVFISQPDYFFEKLFGYRVDGILGSEFFNQFLWDIDGPGKTFRVLTEADNSFESFTPDYSFGCDFNEVPRCNLSGTYFGMDIGSSFGADAIFPLPAVQRLFDLGIYNLTHFQEGHSGQHVIRGMHGFLPALSFGGRYLVKNFAVSSGNIQRITFYFLSRGRALINPHKGWVKIADQRERRPYVPIVLGLDLVKTDKGHLIYGTQQGCHQHLRNFKVGDYIQSIEAHRKGICTAATRPKEILPTIYHSKDLPIIVTGFRGDKRITEIIHMAPACTPDISW